MLLKTILNHVEKHKGFVYRSVQFAGCGASLSIVVTTVPRAGSSPICSGCHETRPGYDHLPVRLFQFVPLWGIAVFFAYAMRRANCPSCGIVVEEVPWAEGKHQLTKTYSWFLATWAKRMSWSDVAKAFRTSWESVFRSVQMAVEWGRANMNLDGITSLGVDEIQWKCGQKYLTLVYQIDEHRKRLLWIGKDRTEATLHGFFDWLGMERTAALKFICSDMWKNYLTVIAKRAVSAINVLDRFHIMAHMSKAIDEVRAADAKALKAKGFEPILKWTRWLLLKRPENLTEKQEVRLADLLRYNLRTVRAYLLKEDFQFFWEYVSDYWAGKFLDRWCTRTLRSRLEPMKRVANMLRRHRILILNWFKAKGSLSCGAVEGLNNKARVTTKRAYGFRTYDGIEIALYHTLGDLPVPKFTHEFC
jgi:transposase